jgi:hypothetical protein
MENYKKDSYTFIQFLLTKNEVKIYLFVAIAFSVYQADGLNSFFLGFCFWILVALGISFFEYKLLNRRIEKGKAIEMLGRELTEKNEPNLFNAAKKDYEATKEKIKNFANTDCAGNIETAIMVLETEILKE